MGRLLFFIDLAEDDTAAAADAEWGVMFKLNETFSAVKF